MPLPSQKAALEKVTQLQGQVFAEEGNTIGAVKTGAFQEDRRRRGSMAIKAAPVAAKPTARAETPTAIAPKPTPVPPPEAQFDRLHKFATSRYGGYVIVGPIHDAVDADPFPNSGYPLEKATAATIALGIQKAILMLPDLKPQERVAVIILSSAWIENIDIPLAGIDIFGWGRPRLRGRWTVGSMADTSFYDLDFHSTDNTFPTVLYQPQIPPPILFDAVKPGMYGCRIYSALRAVHIQRRFYMEDCQIFQTQHLSGQNDDEQCAPLKVEMMGGEHGWSVMKNCQVYSWLNTNDPFSVVPGAFAIDARSFVPGTFYIGKIGDEDSYGTLTGLLLDHCNIYGSLLVQQWAVKHCYCKCLAPITGPEVGGVYARLRGQPLGNPDFYADATALAFFDHSEVRARVIAQTVTWPTSIGVHHGRGYVAFRHSEQLRDWLTPGAATFISDSLGVGIADVVQSSTPAVVWEATGANWAVVTFGDCPTSVTGNRDLYLM